MHTVENDGPTAIFSTHRADDRRPIKVALCGSHDLKGVPETLFKFLDTLPTGSHVMLRRGLKSKPGLFEQAVAAYLRLHKIDYWWIAPDPEGGREATYIRDVNMTRRADLVLCYFAADRMEGGTEHIVEKALDALTPVYSWGFDGVRFVRIGEHDPDNIWADIVPAV